MDSPNRGTAAYFLLFGLVVIGGDVYQLVTGKVLLTSRNGPSSVVPTGNPFGIAWMVFLGVVGIACVIAGIKGLIDDEWPPFLGR